VGDKSHSQAVVAGLGWGGSPGTEAVGVSAPETAASGPWRPPSNGRDCRMTALGRIAARVMRMLERRRLRWTEISVTRAWSHDLPPRLFDLSDF
jgi:hypothetical protein